MKTFEFAQKILNLKPMTHRDIADHLGITYDKSFHLVHNIKATRFKYTWREFDGLFNLVSINKREAGRSRKIFIQLIEEVKGMLIEGLGYRDISERIYIDLSTVRKLCIEYGIDNLYCHERSYYKSKDTKKLESNKDKVIELMSYGVSVLEISRRLGVNPSNTYFFISVHNLRNKPEIKKSFMPKTDIQKLAFGKW